MKISKWTYFKVGFISTVLVFLWFFFYIVTSNIILSLLYTVFVVIVIRVWIKDFSKRKGNKQ